VRQATVCYHVPMRTRRAKSVLARDGSTLPINFAAEVLCLVPRLTDQLLLLLPMLYHLPGPRPQNPLNLVSCRPAVAMVFLGYW